MGQVDLAWLDDFSDLSKGDVILTSRIESVLGVSRDAPNYWTEELRYKSMVYAWFEQIKGVTVTLKQCAAGLTILTDAQASSYNQKRFKNGMKDLRRINKRMVGVDTSRLTAEQAKAHDRDMAWQAKRLRALEDADKRAKLVSVKPKI